MGPVESAIPADMLDLCHPGLEIMNMCHSPCFFDLGFEDQIQVLTLVAQIFYLLT